ncbi:MAG: XrtV sorting system accessory protein [Erythrobacter sp.]
MQSVYDWASVLLFCVLAVTLLHRSMQPPFHDRIVAYLPPAVGCAFGNWLGNEGHAAGAVLILASSALYLALVIRPLARRN